MKEFLKCRVCGYIMDKDGAPDICPACGVGSKAFEDYRYNLSEWRRIVMSIDVHPIALHLPQAVSVLIPLFAILSLFLPLHYSVRLTGAVEILVYVLPVSVLGALVTGLFDGRVRFKKLNTPALKKKIFMGSILFIITVIMAFMVYKGGADAALLHVSLLAAAALLIQAVLARIGIKLMYAYMPGN